jgi:hypothetical protein
MPLVKDCRQPMILGNQRFNEMQKKSTFIKVLEDIKGASQ